MSVVALAHDGGSASAARTHGAMRMQACTRVYARAFARALGSVRAGAYVRARTGAHAGACARTHAGVARMYNG
eukprot:3785721-Pleurochrysis_carterae.AAC.1